MKNAIVVIASFVLSSAATFAGLQWPTGVKIGWFELDGRPLAIDGHRVEDWRHANEILARSTAEIMTKMNKIRGSERGIRELFDRDFEIDYVPRDEQLSVRVVVRRFMSTRLLTGGSHHPSTAARYEVVTAKAEER